MSYEDYIWPEDIESDTRKKETYETLEQHGELAALDQNAARENPLALGTMRTYINHMKKLGRIKL